MSFLFDSRLDAGKKLSNHLDRRIDVDTVVIPYPEACELGLEVARSQDADISVRLSGLLKAPDFQQSIGAVAEDGTIYLDDELVQDFGVDKQYIKDSASILSNALSEKSISFKENCSGVAVIVSDGASQGFREAAVAGSLLKKGFKEVHIATPVKARNFRVDLESIVDNVFYLEEVVFKDSSPSPASTKVKGQKQVLNKGKAAE